MPAMPHRAAGPRMEPPVSVPRPPRIRPGGTAAPVPLLEPPVKWSGFHGLRAGGHGRSKDGPPSANSCVDSLPISTVPASTSFTAQVASVPGTLPINCADWQVVRIPLVSIMSFSPIGMPSSGPSAVPAIPRLGGLRIGQRAIICDGDEAVERGIQSRDLCQALLGEFDRRDRLRRELRGCLRDGDEFGAHAATHSPGMKICAGSASRPRAFWFRWTMAAT